MPRQLLRDGAVVDDDWVYFKDTLDPAAAPDAAASKTPTRLILPFQQWQAERARWPAGTVHLGVVLQPADKVEDLASDLSRFELIAAEFSGPSDGRGYTQARLLRERYQFKGELRASGYVRYDQVFFLARCGFNSFELPQAELSSDGRAFKIFSARYQASNDAGLPAALRHR